MSTHKNIHSKHDCLRLECLPVADNLCGFFGGDRRFLSCFNGMTSPISTCKQIIKWIEVTIGPSRHKISLVQCTYIFHPQPELQQLDRQEDLNFCTIIQSQLNHDWHCSFLVFIACRDHESSRTIPTPIENTHTHERTNAPTLPPPPPPTHTYTYTRTHRHKNAWMWVTAEEHWFGHQTYRRKKHFLFSPKSRTVLRHLAIAVVIGITCVLGKIDRSSP